MSMKWPAVALILLIVAVVVAVALRGAPGTKGKPEAKLEGGGVAPVGSTTAHEGGGEALFIDKDGNVSIGTTEHDYRLTVAGTVKAEKFEGLRCGKKVAPGLYEVHTRVLWDVGWLDSSEPTPVSYTTIRRPTRLTYGKGETRFLGALSGPDVPKPQTGAERKVRLYVYYFSRPMGESRTPTVRITSDHGEPPASVAFHLPQVGVGEIAANWSDYRTSDQYEDIGHASIEVYVDAHYYQENFLVGKEEVFPVLGFVYRIEAHFYDAYPERAPAEGV